MVARRRPKWFPVWLAAFITWFTLCKYLICTRCENYGKACDFYYLGKWAARLFPAQPGKSLDAAGIIAEGGSVAILQLLPAIAALQALHQILDRPLESGHMPQLQACREDFLEGLTATIHKGSEIRLGRPSRPARRSPTTSSGSAGPMER